MRWVPIMPIKRRIALVVPACALAAILAAPANGAFPGKPGPLVYPRVNINEAADTGGLVLHGPRQKQKPQRLTSNPGDETPSFSANGRSVAFSGNSEPIATAVGRHVYLVNVDGSGQRQLTTGTSFDSNPSFSPNGKQVVFDRHAGTGKTHVFIVNVDG